MFYTEDVVRDNAKIYLGFDDKETEVEQGTGQLTTFNQLGFIGEKNKPDGWYLPINLTEPAIILETKNSNEDLNNKKWIDELLNNIKIVNKKYRNSIGILYNGDDIKVFKNSEEIKDVTNKLENKAYYLDFFRRDEIDKQFIYNKTKSINDALHFHFGVKNLYHRMIFTACSLVAIRFGAYLYPQMNFNDFKYQINKTLEDKLSKHILKNKKIKYLIDCFNSIQYNAPNNQKALNNFIEWVKDISECIHSSNWHGEDVMGIFFNEFNRYKGKSESGQVFTPDHITSLMYRLINVNMNDRVLDATCGSGAFLVKAMCNMVDEAGGVNTQKAKEIKSYQLFGIEYDKEIFSLACANMLIHKDGKTNLEHLNTLEEEACNWIKSKNITKVLMNPPFERKYGCIRIIKNVLDSVPENTLCAFILPDKKLEKEKSTTKKILKKHSLLKIIKMPEKIFSGVTASIFIFKTGVPHNNRDVIGYYIENDGLETVKNQGRQDIYNKWQDIENYWVDIINNHKDHDTYQIINKDDVWSYQMPKPEFEISQEDFLKTMIDYKLFEEKIDKKEFSEKISDEVLYNGEIEEKDNNINISLKGKVNEN